MTEPELTDVIERALRSFFPAYVVPDPSLAAHIARALMPLVGREPFGYLMQKAGINNGYYWISAKQFGMVEERFRHLYKPIYAAPSSQTEEGK